MNQPDPEKKSTLQVISDHPKYRAVVWAALWGGIAGLVAIWPDLADAVPKAVYVVVGILLPSAVEIAKLFGVPGATE